MPRAERVCGAHAVHAEDRGSELEAEGYVRSFYQL
jgi:hypothetical protein